MTFDEWYPNNISQVSGEALGVARDTWDAATNYKGS